MDDPPLMESGTYLHDDHTVENSHAIDIPITQVKEHSPNEEKHNTKQHKPENGNQDLLEEAQRNCRSTFSGFHVWKAIFIACNFMFYIYFFKSVHVYFKSIISTK